MLVVQDKREDGVLLGVGERVRARLAAADGLDLACQLGDAEGVLGVEADHLHVARALARTPGEVVLVVLEVERFEAHEREDGADFAGRVHFVLQHGVDQVRRGLRAGAAFFGKFGPGACGGQGEDVDDNVLSLAGGTLRVAGREVGCRDGCGGCGASQGEDEC